MMTGTPLFYYTFVSVSFVVTVVVDTWVLRWLKPKPIWWCVALLVLMVGSIVWLGLFKGWFAMLLAGFLSSQRVANWVDCRRFGKKVAQALGLKANLFFTAVELAFPRGDSVIMLAEMGRSGTNVDDAKRVLLLPVVQGLDALEGRFGPQRNITEAREQVASLVNELYATDGLAKAQTI
jgi:hypothetical protein